MGAYSRLIKNTFFDTFGNIFILISGFILLPIMVAKMGPDQYGLFLYLRLFTSLGILSLLDCGISLTVTKFVSEYYTSRNYGQLKLIIVTAVIILGFIGILFGALCIQFSIEILNLFSVDADSAISFHLALKIVFLTWPIELLGGLFYAIMIGIQQFFWVKLIDLLITLSQFILSIIFLRYGYNFSEIFLLNLALLVFKHLILFIFCYLFLHKIFKKTKIKINAKGVNKILPMAKHIFLSQSSSMIANHGEKFIVAIFLQPAQMVAYEILVKLPRMIKSYLSLGTSAVMPAATEFMAKDNNYLNSKLFENGLQLNQIFIFPITLSSIYLSNQFILAWVGPDFLQYVIMLQVLLLFNLLNPLSSFGWSIMMGINREIHYISRLQWSNTIIKLLIWILFTPIIGLWAIVLGFFTVALTIPWSINIPCKVLGVREAKILLDTGRVLLASMTPYLIFSVYELRFKIDTIYEIALAGFVWSLMATFLYLFAFASADFRVLVRDFLLRKTGYAKK